MYDVQCDECATKDTCHFEDLLRRLDTRLYKMGDYIRHVNASPPLSVQLICEDFKKKETVDGKY